MKIIYVARHGQRNNDDEGAITYALRKLGHEVVCIGEHQGQFADRRNGDFILFHHWYSGISELEALKTPKVFWYFDLVWYPDETLRQRCEKRVQYVRQITDLCDVGFLTDGDWVARDWTGKLVHLNQGADERVVGSEFSSNTQAQLLLYGVHKGAGVGRKSHIDELRNKYNSRLTQVVSGKYREDLRDLISKHLICIAPDSPSTDRYWSNRVYVTLGFGGFLLHPYCEELTKQYAHCEEIIYYNSRDDLHRLVNEYLPERITRREIADAGLERTKREHLYRHRCEKLTSEVEARLG